MMKWPLTTFLIPCQAHDLLQLPTYYRIARMLTKIQTLGFICAALSAALYGTNPAFAVPLYHAGMNPVSVLIFRYALGVPFLALLLICRGESVAMGRRQILPVAALGVGMAFSSLMLYEAYLRMNPGVASTLLFMYPVLTALLMSIFFHEKFRLVTGCCLVLMGIGIYFLLIGPEGASVNLEGMIYITLSSLAYAIYLVAVKVSRAIRSLPTINSLLYQLFFGSFLFLAMLPFVTLTPPASVSEWGLLMGIAFLPTVLSLLLTMKAISLIGPTPTAIFGGLEPVTAVVLSIVILGEGITLREIGGGILILMATLLVMTASGKRKKPGGGKLMATGK